MSEPAARWQVIIQRRSQKVLRRLPRAVLQRIREAIWALADNPHPPGCKKITGHENLWRIRVGDWRIIYAIEADRLVILIVEIAPRGGAYREL